MLSWYLAISTDMKTFWVSMTTEATTGSEGGGGGGVQLQCDTSPLDVTKFYTLNR